MEREQLLRVVERATLAPSVHNTQPWRWVVGHDVVDLYADRSRGLSVIDPTGRQLTISCGAALGHACLAVRAEGRSCSVVALPDPADPDHLARVGIDGPDPPTRDEVALVRQMARRHTYREPFDPRPVPDPLVEALRHGVALEGAWLHPVELPEDLATLAAVQARADLSQRLDPAYVTELSSWLRHDEPATDGVPRSAVPEQPVARRHTAIPLRDFALGEAGGPPGAPLPDEHPLVVVLGTDGDDPPSWLDAGRALSWLLLRSAVAGVAASPLNQVLDLPATRSLLARELRLVGHPQMVLRMGYGVTRPSTPRRPVEDVVTVTGGVP